MTNVSYTESLLKSFENYLQVIQWQKSPLSLYQPVDYILSLGGKRIRPLSILYINGLLKGPSQIALHTAYALELFHNFSLIHDDIMDQALLRRSQPTVHQKFGTNNAILSGDVMMIDAMGFILKAETESGILGLQQVFIETARQVCEGQAMDMDFELRQRVSYPEYLDMIRLKTAVLLAAGFKMAALISDRPELADDFYLTGINTGIAFQLEDDWLDFYADKQTSGKVKGGDIIQSKKSALILELAEQFNPLELENFIEWYNPMQDPEAKLRRMEHYFDEFGIKEKLRNRIKLYQQKAYDCLEQLALTSEQKELMYQFIKGIFSRTS